MNLRKRKKHGTIYFQQRISGEYYTVVFKGMYLAFHLDYYFAKGLPHRFKEKLALANFNNGMKKIGKPTQLHFTHHGLIVNN